MLFNKNNGWHQQTTKYGQYLLLRFVQRSRFCDLYCCRVPGFNYLLTEHLWPIDPEYLGLFLRLFLFARCLQRFAFICYYICTKICWISPNDFQKYNLTLWLLGKYFSRYFEIFSYFLPENRIWQFKQLVSIRDISNSVFRENKLNKIINWSSAEFAQRVVNINEPQSNITHWSVCSYSHSQVWIRILRSIKWTM